MNTSITYKRIWHVAYPIILGSVAQNLINFTDTAFLGRVGEVALGAGALGGIFYLAVIMLGLGFGTGAQIIIARRYGEGNLKAVGPVVDHTISFLFVMALISYWLLQYGSEYILEWFVTSENVKTATIEFLNYRSFGIFFAFLNVSFRAFYVGLAKTKVITYTTIVLAIVNIILDYLLIFGHYGFPELGIKGAAIASVIAEICALTFFVIYTATTIKSSDYGLFRFLQFSFERLKNIVRIAAPIMMQMFLSLAVWFVLFLFIEKLGESALAVSNIIRSILVVLLVPVWGFATATNTLVSYLIGNNRTDEVMGLIKKIVVLCFIGVLIVVSFGVSFPRLIFEIYTNDTYLIELGIPILYIISMGAIALSFGFILFNGVSGTGKTNISLTIEIIVLSFYLAFGYSIVYIFNYGVNLVWTVEILYGTMLGFLSYLYLRSGKWKSSKV